jgi:DNA-binding NtrC family response regulator
MHRSLAMPARAEDWSMTAIHELTGREFAPPERDELRSFDRATRRPGVLLALADARSGAELGAFLTRQGFNVWLAGGGVEAITIYLEHTGSIDLLLLDAELHDLPGQAFLRRFATHFPGVPCLFRSGESAAVAVRLRAVSATIVPASLDPIAIAERLWEIVAFEFLVEA